ncbi:MAG: hypothetical protein FWG89_08985 [Treponema sp.]|nr:hypothetical protein [Treponema sp.]
MNEQEWKDVNPQTADLPDKGRAVILCIVGGIAFGIVGFVGMKIRPVGLAVGIFALMTGISMFIRKNRKVNAKTAALITAAGFLILLANPRFGFAAGIAGTFIIIGAIGLVALGLVKAIKLSWDLGKKY